ncbi:hypothetical protein AEAC466_21165 [Asticcacaulis sp. AC466]|nr:hypothetical protein AEAC466_21165 [Asticcacaulis sp. AC466]
MDDLYYFTAIFGDEAFRKTMKWPVQNLTQSVKNCKKLQIRRNSDMAWIAPPYP